MFRGDDLAGRLIGLSEATRRAYSSDLADLAQWCQAHGLGRDRRVLRGSHVFAYLLGLIREGRTRSTVRRRLTALRRFVASAGDAASGFAFDVDELSRLERRLVDVRTDRASVLVVCDDAVIRAGIRWVLSEAGSACWSERVEDFEPSVVRVWDYVLVWITSARGSDRFGAISSVRALTPELTTAVPVVAVHGAAVAPVVRLRLAEAGFRYLVPQDWLSDSLPRIASLLSNANIPLRYHLESPLALRESIGLHLSGDFGDLVDAAAELPTAVWAPERSDGRHALARADINRLRSLALRSGGIPAPDFAKYATSVRRPPELPEWPRVRELLRQGMGYSNTTDIASAQ